MNTAARRHYIGNQQIDVFNASKPDGGFRIWGFKHHVTFRPKNQPKYFGRVRLILEQQNRCHIDRR